MKTLILIALLGAAPAYADSIACHIIYGGENFSVNAQPTADPYRVKGEKIGRYFEVKVSYATAPADLAALSIYVYAASILAARLSRLRHWRGLAGRRFLPSSRSTARRALRDRNALGFR